MEIEYTFYGYNQFKKIMKQADPDMRKRMDREIRSFITPVAKRAKEIVPVVAARNWKSGGKGTWNGRLWWDQSTVKKGISVRQGGRRKRGSAMSAAWKIQNKSAPGAVYELAGRKNSGSSLSGRAFINALTAAESRRPSRLIWSAWDEMGGKEKITKDVIKVVDQYASELEQKLNVRLGGTE